MAHAKFEQVPTVERILLRLDGSPFYATVTSKQLIYKGEPATQIIVQDIDKLKTSEKRYSDLFNSVAEGIILFDAVYDGKGAIIDFRCTDVNPAYEDVLGRVRNEVIGKNLLEFIAENDLPRMDEYKKVVLDGKPIHYETYMARIEKYFDVYTYCPAPKQLGILFRDITERKKLEDVLKHDKETLEKLVIERSHELIEAHADLERAKRLSDIGTLAATVAHELRNPLVAVNISASILRKKVSDPSLKKHLDNIDKSLEESEQTINNLLLYSKINPPQLEKVTLWNIFEECAANSPCLAKKHRINSKLEVLKNVSIKVDPHQIKEVFYNILNNAYEAMENKKGQIDIWAVEDKDFIKVFIKDNGVGIPKEHLEEVFSPFFTTKPRGTGLGLAVCYQIIHAHGGAIDVESAPRKGTTVSITLPKK
jgi:PAS domain S-box-containing protein